MLKAIVQVPPRVLETVIPLIRSTEEAAREDEIEKRLEAALGLSRKSLWCRVLIIHPFDDADRQVLFATHDNDILIVRMVQRNGQWVRALPGVVQTANVRMLGTAL